MSTDNAVVHPRRSFGAGEPDQGLCRWWVPVTVVLAADLFVEAIFAGAMLSGAPWARAAHAANAALLILASLIAGLAAIAALRRVPQGLRLGLTLLALAALVLVQTGLGRASAHGAHLLWLHVPLGVALVGGAMQSVAVARRLGEP
jgi:hypothetical protein